MPVSSSETTLSRLVNERGADVYSRMCPSRGVLEHVTSRWGVWVLMALREKELRFFRNVNECTSMNCSA